MNKSVAIITARGGSKRIPRKNIKDFLGKPIIAYSIAAALEAGCFDEVMVSTDDLEIAEISERYGAKIPFLRSEKTSDDFSNTADVILEVLAEYQNRGMLFDHVCCIYPTAPFITSEKLRNSYDILLGNNADSVFQVVRYSTPIQRAFKIDDGFLRMIQPENMNIRSQDLVSAYHDSAQFYWFNVDRFIASKRILMEHTVPIEVSDLEVQDIDNEEDWKIAEFKYRLLKN